VRLLLDTHIWLWSLLSPDRLSRRVCDAITAPANELWLSPISVWESILLIERGRVQVEGDSGAWVEQMLHAAPVREAPLTFEVAAQSRRAKLPHTDPADRFLVATALVQELTLVTADERLLKAKVCATLANR
jgi:PIN domain nuclease of toxin-antitoxin system